MNIHPTCPSCGAPLVAGHDGLNCAVCLLKLALGPAEPVRMPPLDVPEPAALQAWFPDLEILGVLGMGGMGVVYKVRQPALDRLAALKVLPESLVGHHGFRDRFEREARTLAALVHPNIVTIHDFGERGGHFFLLMEYVGGGDLARLMATGKLSARQALALVPPLCDALQCAHEHGVIHRDIKPANILLDDHGRVKIADFGVARILGQGGTDAGANEYLLGTPAYMAPEERSEPQSADHRADIFSLGVLIYEMLTGQSPGTPPDPPSRHCRIDHRIDDIVLRALAANPANRQQHIEELRMSLEKILAPGIRPRTVWTGAALLLAVMSILAWQLVVARKTPVDPLPPIWKNSLGMPFRPLPGSANLLCVRETTLGDWLEAARDLGLALTSAQSKEMLQLPKTSDELDDAEIFCRWLTRRDRAAGKIGPGESYRLPTDAEWSLAAGAVEPSAPTPSELHLHDKTTYPWGTTAPAPPGAGNYPDSALAARWPDSRTIPGYYDGHAFSAPTGSFAPNAAGFHDLGGNVWEQTLTRTESGTAIYTWRGGSWNAGSQDGNWQMLLTSWRGRETNELLPGERGFRVLLDRNSGSESSLLAAIRAGNKAMVRDLLDRKQGLAENDIHGVTPLLAAAAEADVEMVSMLLDAGVSTTQADDRGQSALHLAARRGNADAVRLLLAKGAPVAARDRLGRQATHHAASGGHVAVLEELAAAKAPLHDTNVTGTTPAGCAASAGQSGALIWLLDHAGPAGFSQDALTNILTSAVLGAHEDIVDVLLARGAAVKNEQSDNMVLRIAAIWGRSSMFRKLLAATPDPLPDSLLHSAATSPIHGIRTMLRKSPAWAGEGVKVCFALESKQESIVADKAEVVRLIVARKVPIEHRSAKGGYTPLLTASYHGVTDAARAMLDLGADITARDDEGFTALHSASEQNHPTTVRLLLDRRADIHARTNDGRTVLGTAMGHNAEAVVEMLLQAGAKPDELSSDMTPLALAAQRGLPKSLEVLLRYHADPNFATRRHVSPMSFACQGPTVAIQEQANSQAKRISDSNNYLMTHVGSEEDYLECIRLLVEAGTVVQPEKSLCTTALHVAAEADFEAAVRLLLGHGAAVDFSTELGNTPLFLAASSNALRAARVLLEHGASVAPPTLLESCLHAAARGGHVEMMTLLLEHGANPNGKDGKSATPLHWAVLRDKPEAVRLLAAKAADVNARDFVYSTPLHIAASLPHPQVITALLDAGADPKARNLEGLTARQVAELRRQFDNVFLLRAAESQP